ncbi:MAG TPA: hypothetical protein VFR37_01350 [Longimicrobium sp.]|nr:hypothetical protein [Longimicrobium sp.]
MPVSVTFDGRILWGVLAGALTVEELDRFIMSVEELEAAAQVWPDRITDLTAVDRIDIGYDEISRLVQRRRETAVPNPIRNAMVVRDPVQLGYARMYQTLSDNPRITVRVFPDVEQALAWLAEEAGPAE